MGLLSLEYGLTLAALANLSIAGNVRVIVVRVSRIETVEGVAEPHQIACLRIDEAGEDVLTSVETEALEEVDDVTVDSLDVIVCGGTNHRIKGVGSGGKGSNDIIWGQHDARMRTAAPIQRQRGAAATRAATTG